ncbi:hypothetical protein ONE56_00980 [Vibrio mytili]|uniref:hypothetical protein n=1 Tax=Vibrio mytili TaxID=50718 RepID=UPI003C6FA520
MKVLFLYAVMFFSSFIICLSKERFDFYFLLLILVIIFVTITFKSRGSLSYSLIPLVYLSIIRGLNYKKIAKLLLLSIIFVLLIVVLKSYRWLSSGSFTLIDMFDLSLDIFKLLFVSGDFSIVKYYFSSISYCMNNACYDWSIVDKLLVSRFIGDLVITPAYALWNILQGTPNVGGSLHLLSYGASFFDGAWLGGLYFIFLSFVRMFSIAFLEGAYRIFCIGPLLYFSLFFSRGSVYNAIPVVILSLGLVFLLSILIRRNNK